ncbi:MAG TPA: cellulase family glycosylhydrolase, partial [Acidimicrobiia bacterium]|nr:cellulase family glycosylhydrolase [Acidimicrobiia bacterium]
DPLDALYSDAYVERVAAGVALARSHGLVVVLSVQDQGPSGGDSHAQPSAATIRDWQTLTALFNGDQHVIYEIFNEPQNKPTPDGWEIWRNGGPPERNQGTPAVGHQRVLEAIRATGATNVVIADAGQFGQRLDGVPLLHDPLGQVAYGVHPYLTHSLREPDDWEPGFGFLASQYPVVATEWTAVSRVRFCRPEWETTAPQLVDYLQDRNIGMLAWAFDVLDTLILDWHDRTPTSLEGFRCGDFDHGAGELVKAEIPNWQPQVTPCHPSLSDEGVLAVPVDVPAAGAYRLWSRVRPTDGPAASSLQVDDGCPGPGWSGGDPKDGWAWRTGPQTLQLSAGRHTLRFLGAAGGSHVDRILLTTDTGCDPADPARPCPPPTPTTTTTTTASPTTGPPPTVDPSTTTTSRARRPPIRRREPVREHRPPVRGRRSTL